MSVNNFPERFEALKRAINRCFDKGIFSLPERSVRQYLEGHWGQDIDLSDYAVVTELQEWEKQGFTRLIGGEERFIEIVKKFALPPSRPVNNYPERLEILKAAINRFFFDFNGKWSLENVRDILMANWPEDVDPRDSVVVENLKEWEKQGVIKYVGKEDCYFQVLKKFERDPGQPRIAE